ncbi:MAG: hypothetical protein N3D73_00580 [Candidatus Diapherotrites archaeon]|nr:hypothetical protein [Candidatus Diapherotrites archaeon]
MQNKRNNLSKTISEDNDINYVFCIVVSVLLIVIAFIVYSIFTHKPSGFTQIYFVDYNNFSWPVLSFSFVVDSQEISDFNYKYRLFFGDELIKEENFYLKKGEKKHFFEDINLTKYNVKFPLKVTISVNKILQDGKEDNNYRKIWFWVFR